MLEHQPYTPKYWVFHNTNNDDVYISTLSKSRDRTIELASELLEEHELQKYYEGEDYEVSLVEIKKVNL